MSIDRRNTDRYNVQVSAKLRDGADKAKGALLTNLSASGCRFSSTREFEVGATVTVAVGRAETLDGKVKWRDGAMHGIRFDKPLNRTLLDHIRLFLSANPALIAERADGDLAA